MIVTKIEGLAELDRALREQISEFRDGAGKTAIAVDLFGKSGANLLPFLKDLVTGKQNIAQFSASIGKALDDRNKVVQDANERYATLWNAPLLSDAVQKRFDEMRKQAEQAQKEPAKPALNYSTAKNRDNQLSVIEQRVKGLQALADEEASIMRDRQRVIDLYENQGYLKFQEATVLRANAQADFLERSKQYYDEEERLLRGALNTVAKTAQERARVEEQLAGIALKRQRLEREAAQATLERAIKSPFETLRDIQEQAARGQADIKAREDQIKTLRESGAITELEQLRRLASARQESANQLVELAAKAREVADAAPGNEKLADAMRKIEEAARQAADGASLLSQRAKELSDPEAGFAKGLRTVAEEAELVGKQMESATVKAFNGMTEALTNFVMTGKLDFRSLANSIIADLIRIQIQKAIVKPLANAMGSLFGFADGGVMTSGGPVPLRGYATGGVANSPQVAVFGEGSKPEAYVPLPDGRTIPVTMSGGAAGGDVFNISVSVSDAGAATSGDDAGGRDLGKAIASAVRQELLAQKRAGGLLDARRAA